MKWTLKNHGLLCDVIVTEILSLKVKIFSDSCSIFLNFNISPCELSSYMMLEHISECESSSERLKARHFVPRILTRRFLLPYPGAAFTLECVKFKKSRCKRVFTASKLRSRGLVIFLQTHFNC